jgi:predicted mannosyl-3-phosphoglycerate phosphatase (HAD superfamily)
VEIIALADMTIDEVARDFGLPLAGARLATLREYSELFRVVDDRPASRGRLFRGLHAAGMTCTHGERYELATGVNDRTAALQTVHRLFQRARGRVVRIGIGSHAGDLPVLAQADVRIVVRNGQSSITAPMIAHMPSVWVIEERGTEGWLQAIIRVTESLNRTAP